ncbi:hypothetical protein pb186bvf_016638 [Paramecium bursaria]
MNQEEKRMPLKIIPKQYKQIHNMLQLIVIEEVHYRTQEEKKRPIMIFQLLKKFNQKIHFLIFYQEDFYYSMMISNKLICFLRKVQNQHNHYHKMIKKYNLSDTNIDYINEQVKLIQQIDQELEKLNSFIKSESLSQSQQNILQEKIQPIQAKFKQSINQKINKDVTNANNNVLQEILKEFDNLKLKFEQVNERVIYLENQPHQIIQKNMNEIKQDNNQYIYYQSLYWRLYNYLSACQQLSTDLFQKNTDAVIDNDQERVTQIISKVVQQISNQAGSIPIVGTVITIISNALEFGFSYHIDYKFNKIVMNLTQMIQVRCDSRNHIDEQIQLAIIKQSKQLQELTQDQQIEEQRLIKHLQQIQQAEMESGNIQADNPYWKQGIVDTLRILRNLLVNYKQIQQDKKKELHIVILESIKDDDLQIDNHQVVKTGQSCCGSYPKNQLEYN